jgi:microsomal epoxide hydrolase
VLDSLAFLHTHGDSALAGLVLIDNSVGEDPPPPPPKHPYHKAPRQTHAAFMASFVRSMFKRPQPPSFLQELTEAALRTPEPAANALLSYNVPRTYWKEAVYATAKPVLYVVRPGFAGQAGNLAAHHPAAETVVVPDLGHAMFVDDPARFNAIMQSFLSRRVGG